MGLGLSEPIFPYPLWLTRSPLPPPLPGSRPPHALEITPTGLPRPRPAGLSPQTAPAYRAHMQSPGPSPAIFNFTLQNLGLISAGPGSAGAQQQHQTPERGPGPGASPLLGVHQRGGVLFVKPLSSTPLQQAGPGQPLTFISVQQVRPPPPLSLLTCCTSWHLKDNAGVK